MINDHTFAQNPKTVSRDALQRRQYPQSGCSREAYLKTGCWYSCSLSAALPAASVALVDGLTVGAIDCEKLTPPDTSIAAVIVKCSIMAGAFAGTITGLFIEPRVEESCSK